MSSVIPEDLSHLDLPPDVLERLSELDLELAEGDITQKGYEKKRRRLLQPFLDTTESSALLGAAAPTKPSSKIPVATKRSRVTRSESRYHSEARHEAVQHVLAQAKAQEKTTRAPMPSKRKNSLASSKVSHQQHHNNVYRNLQHADSSSDEDSATGRPLLSSSPSTATSHESLHTPQAGPHAAGGGIGAIIGNSGQQQQQTTIADQPPPLPPTPRPQRLPPPDVTQTSSPSSLGGRQASQASGPGIHTPQRGGGDQLDAQGDGARWKVSAKIQQLLQTLKRPKKRTLPEFYQDDESFYCSTNATPVSAPPLEGPEMEPVIGEKLELPAGLPLSVEAALQRYGTSTMKAPAATVLDGQGKVGTTLLYGKLWSRARKIAYALLNRFGKATSKGGAEGNVIKVGDRVALVYPNNDPLGFMCALYGCLTAGVIPVAVELPLSRRDASTQQIGFLLGSCGISHALTSEVCFKGLPKSSTGEPAAFKGWPRLEWCVTEHLTKPPKDWQPSPRHADSSTAYIEYYVDKEGSMKGVAVTRQSLVSHSRALTAACGYTEGDVMVCVVDYKREMGLWHCVLTSVLNGMHVVFIPYSLLKTHPAAWMLSIPRFKATVSVCKSRDLHWGVQATRDNKEVNLSTLRLLLVTDGANPWSLSSCDEFIATFHSRGLRPETVCPCACSPEGLTVSVRRPGRVGAGSSGRGVLSMAALSCGVIRVDLENSLTSLTIQDCGHILPECTAVVVKLDGPAQVCRTDEIGEICISSSTAASSYWGLQGLTQSIFKVQPLSGNGKPVAISSSGGGFVRTGLLGFVGPGGLVFVCGSREGLIQAGGRQHNTDDLIATILAVEPVKFIYRGRIVVFGVKVLRDERIVVVAEQRPDCSEEESFQWMSRVLQAVDSIHQAGIFCLALVPPGYLPKTPLGGIHTAETRRRFLEGSLHPANILMCPHACVTNLPKPREPQPVGPASVLVGSIVQGVRLASASGRELGPLSDSSSAEEEVCKYQFIGEILKWRAASTPDHVLFTLVTPSSKAGAPPQLTTLSCVQLFKKAERIASMLIDKAKVNVGDNVALVYPAGLDLTCAFYGCLYAGLVPVAIRPPHSQNLAATLPTVRMIVDVSQAALVLTTAAISKLLRGKEATALVDARSWPTVLDTDDPPKPKKGVQLQRPQLADSLAYVDFSVSTTGMLAGIKMSHAATTWLCRSMKLACELYPSRHVCLCLEPYAGLGLALWCLSSVYAGHHTLLVPPAEVEAQPHLWLATLSQHQVRDTFCSYGVMELCTRGLGTSIQELKARGLNLSCVRTCVVVAEERPRTALTQTFSKLFSALGLSSRAVSTSFGCRVNVALCVQGASSPDPSSVYVDMRALRNDRVTIVQRGSPHSLCLLESGKLLPGVKVVIANPETLGQCGDSHLGEIWVQSPHSADGFFRAGGDADSDHDDVFRARLSAGETQVPFARTGYLGFLRRVRDTSGQSDAEDSGDDGTLLTSESSRNIDGGSAPAGGGGAGSSGHDAVFVVGALEETIMLRGMRYHPCDIEATIQRCHKKIAECAVFTWTNLLVSVVELDGSEAEALDLVPLVTIAVLEQHQLIVGVVVIVDPGVVPINSRGEKQRMHLRDSFLSDQLDPIYVAYNM
ncbi:disco-interacting protein 2-like isoform X2 [Varroa jacobsoni]|uniref:disco-interacting protein 2-like isoform X2 n=1 Tax=Varroa jacobsoni TaxID=62625 RepID=UPI000BF4DDD0|nr:disco-interacting protein 2-like isoform X2 [Varroa jacobsoni]